MNLESCNDARTPGVALRRSVRAILVILFSAFAWSQHALAETADANRRFPIVSPPNCQNYKGEAVRFIDTASENSRPAAGMARRGAEGQPEVIRSNYSRAPEAFQRFVDLHECAHHQTGDVDRPHPPRNSPEHLMNESISDCIAILRLRDEANYDQEGFDRVAAAMRVEMEKIGFPEISISSRISNIANCYSDYGPASDFIAGVLERRDLLDLNQAK